MRKLCRNFIVKWRIFRYWVSPDSQRQKTIVRWICRYWFHEENDKISLRRHGEHCPQPRVRTPWRIIVRTPSAWTVSPGGSGMKNYLELRATSTLINLCVIREWRTLLQMWGLKELQDRWPHGSTRRKGIERTLITIAASARRMYACSTNSLLTQPPSKIHCL